MSSPPPIPERIPPLSWRRPVLIWLPLSLALSIGWPAALLRGEAETRHLALAAGAIAFALGLVTLGAGWVAGRPPKARRIVVMHIVIGGAIAALMTPYLLPSVLGGPRSLDFAMTLAMAPLALLVGLPAALISGLAFAWLALTTRAPPIPEIVLEEPASPPHLRSSSEL
jgi:hypothetical protein